MRAKIDHHPILILSLPNANFLLKSPLFETCFTVLRAKSLRKVANLCIIESSILHLILTFKINFDTVESRYNGLASNRNLPITDAIPESLETIFFIFYIDNNRNPPTTDENGPLKSVRAGVNCIC